MKTATVVYKKEKGFTLIELLIVVAIIGILAAIAVPSLITGQRRAKYSRAAGDTKSIMTQAMVVVSDNNLAISQIAGMTQPPSPAGLWDGTAPNGVVYMTQVFDPWAAPGTVYVLGQGLVTGCTQAAAGCVTYGVHTIGADGAEGNAGWAGLTAITAGTDDLGNGSVIGCSFDQGSIKLSNPC